MWDGGEFCVSMDAHYELWNRFVGKDKFWCFSLDEFKRDHGVVVWVLTCCAESPRIKITFNQVSRKLSLFSGYSSLFRGWGNSEGRGDGHHPLHAMPNDVYKTLTHCPYGQPATRHNFTGGLPARF